jgi:hypothetical protein
MSIAFYPYPGLNLDAVLSVELGELRDHIIGITLAVHVVIRVGYPLFEGD